MNKQDLQTTCDELSRLANAQTVELIRLRERLEYLEKAIKTLKQICRVYKSLTAREVKS